MTTKTIELKGTASAQIINGQWETTVWEDHRRGKNWTAICTGPNAANVERKFLERTFQDKGGYTLPAAGIAVNDVIEVCADYYTSRNKIVPWRHFLRVTSITESKIEFDAYYTLAQAMKAAKQIREAVSVVEERTPFALGRYVHFTRRNDEPRMMEHNIIWNLAQQADEFDPFEIKGKAPKASAS